ncbi:hypothetical protein CQA66_05555 [Helicobacter aurati]|uniref:Outer membrane beta-barrel protein n=1 Tax=Helicobacter aurati TaxID=137778 RepID=A0A3D8J3W4_9HELI|nr:hypothetical protein [Helicobacter aurati]RDU71930.1 hypothetical protein CQA66_05555 [Helicobacter aurati]
MKKSVLSLGLASVLGMASAHAEQQGGFFVGAFLGNGFNTTHSETTITTNIPGGTQTSSGFSTKTSFDLIYGARLGYIAALNERNAFRIYADFTAGRFTVGDDENYYHMTAGGGLDYLHNFGGVFGLFLGAGYNYAFGDFIKASDPSNPGQIYANLGMSWSLSKIRLELGTKIPFSKYHDQSNNFTFGGVALNGSLYTKTSAQVYLNVDFVF